MNFIIYSLLLSFSILPNSSADLVGKWKIYLVDYDNIEQEGVEKFALKGLIERELLKRNYIFEINDSTCILYENGKIIDEKEIKEITSKQVIGKDDKVILDYQIHKDKDSGDFTMANGTFLKARKMD